MGYFRVEVIRPESNEGNLPVEARCLRTCYHVTTMQLTLKVNGGVPVRGAVRGKGILSALVMVPVDKKRAKASIHALEFDSSDTAEWNAGELSIGDKIEIQFLLDDESDPPTKTGRVSDSPGFLFSDPEQGREALAKMSTCKESLEGILRAAKINEPHEEALNIQRAIVAVVQALGDRLIRPTLSRHPELTSHAEELGLIE